MAYYQPYLNGGPTRRRSLIQRIGTPIFVLLIALTNYWVFVYDSKPEIASIQDSAPLGDPDYKPALPAAVPENLPAPEKPQLDRVPARIVKGAIRRGESLSRVMTAFDIPSKQFNPVIAGLDPLADFRNSHVGDQYRIELNQAGKILKLRYSRNPLEVYESSLSEDGKRYMARKVDVPIRKDPLRVGCVVHGTLYDSLVRCVEDPKLATTIIKLLSFDLNFYQDVRDGDAIRFLVDKEFVNGRFYRYGPVRAMDYQGKFDTLRIVHFDDGTPGGQYYKSDGTTVKRNFLRSPVQYARISSGYQKRRFHPILHRWKQHLAIDYAAPVGTPTWAVAEGKVIFRGRRGPSGNLLIIKHADGYQTSYAHLHRFAKNLKRGDKVSQGQVVGFVGSTGRSTGPHLHFAMRHKNKTINPLKVEGTSIGTVAEEHKEIFQELLEERMDELSRVSVLAPNRRNL